MTRRKHAQLGLLFGAALACWAVFGIYAVSSAVFRDMNATLQTGSWNPSRELYGSARIRRWTPYVDSKVYIAQARPVYFLHGETTAWDARRVRARLPLRAVPQGMGALHRELPAPQEQPHAAGVDGRAGHRPNARHGGARAGAGQ